MTEQDLTTPKTQPSEFGNDELTNPAGVWTTDVYEWLGAFVRFNPDTSAIHVRLPDGMHAVTRLSFDPNNFGNVLIDIDRDPWRLLNTEEARELNTVRPLPDYALYTCGGVTGHGPHCRREACQRVCRLSRVDDAGNVAPCNEPYPLDGQCPNGGRHLIDQD